MDRRDIKNNPAFILKIETHGNRFIQNHIHARFSHGICPECAQKHYSDVDLYEEDES